MAVPGLAASAKLVGQSMRRATERDFPALALGCEDLGPERGANGTYARWEAQMPNEVLRLVDGAVAVFFMGAALAKADAWQAWKATVATLLPTRPTLGRVVGMGVPIAEVLTGITVVVRPRLGLSLACLLLLVFALGVALLTPRHSGEECNCLGSLGSSRIGWALAVRDSLLAVGIGLPLLFARHGASGRASWLTMLSACLLGVLAMVLAETKRLTERAHPAFTRGDHP